MVPTAGPGHNNPTAVAASRVGQVSTGPLFGPPKLSCTRYYWQHQWQIGWQLSVQLLSFKFDLKIAANRVKAPLSDKLHHPKHFTFTTPSVVLRAKHLL